MRKEQRAQDRVKFELRVMRRNLPEDEFLQDIRRVAKSLKKNSVSMSEYEEFGGFSPSGVCKRFGTWLGAVKKAGLASALEQRCPTKRRLFENLKEVWIKLGRQPNQREMKKPLSEHSATPYVRRFGTWSAALAEFVHLMKSGGLESLSEENESIAGLREHRTGRAVSAGLRLIVMRRDNFKCRLCGQSPATDPQVSLEVDHIKAWSEGGETELDNLQTLCCRCNAGKGNRGGKGGREK
jgi:predicted restriction endonuclease